jgi:hypothetical protein
MSICKSARIKGLKYLILFLYVCKRKIHDDKMGELQFKPNYEYRRIFSLEQEKVLVEYILNCSTVHYGLSTEQCRRLTNEMVIVNHIPYPSNWDN